MDYKNKSTANYPLESHNSPLKTTKSKSYRKIIYFLLLISWFYAQFITSSVEGSIQSSSPFLSSFIYQHSPQHNSRVPFKTSFVAPSDFISFRKMNGPLESLSPGSDEPSRLSVETLIGSSSQSGDNNAEYDANLSASSDFESTSNSKPSSAISSNSDDLLLAASSKSPGRSSEEPQQAQNSTTSIATDSKSNEVSSINQTHSSKSNETTGSGSTNSITTTTSSVLLASDASSTTTDSFVSQTTTIKPTTVEITVNLSTLSSNIATETTTSTPQSPLISSTTTTTTSPTPVSSEESQTTTIAPAITSEAIANLTKISESTITTSTTTTTTTTTTPKPEETTVNKLMMSKNASDAPKSTKDTQKERQDAADVAFEQNLTKQVNEFIFLPQDGPLTFEEEPRDLKTKPQGAETPTSELRPEHRAIDGGSDAIFAGDDVELDYLNPESDRLSNGPSKSSAKSTTVVESNPIVTQTSSSTTSTSTTTTTTTSTTTTTPKPSTTTATTITSTPETKSIESGLSPSKLISQVVSMLRNSPSLSSHTTTRAPRFDWKRGRSSSRDQFANDGYFRRDLSPIANGADEEEARILTRLSAPSQLTRLSSPTTTTTSSSNSRSHPASTNSIRRTQYQQIRQQKLLISKDDRRQSDIRSSSRLDIERSRSEEPALTSTSDISRQNPTKIKQVPDRLPATTASNLVPTAITTSTSTTTTKQPTINSTEPIKEVLVKTQRASPVPIPTVGFLDMTSRNSTFRQQQQSTIPLTTTSMNSTTTISSQSQRLIPTTQSTTSSSISTTKETTRSIQDPIEEVLTLIAGSESNQTRANQAGLTEVAKENQREERIRSDAIEAAIVDLVHQREPGLTPPRSSAKGSMQTNSYGTKPRIGKLFAQSPHKTISTTTIIPPPRSVSVKTDVGSSGQSKPSLKLRGSLEEMKQQDEEQFLNTVRAESKQELVKPQRSNHRAITEPPTDTGKWKPDVILVSKPDSNSVVADQMPGRPGIDYPTHWQVPKTSFDCRDFELSGFYADIESSCQAYHSCHKGRGGQHTFLCPNGTLFSQELLTCDWWYNVECSAPNTRSSGKNVNNLDKSFMSRPGNELSSAS